MTQLGRLQHYSTGGLALLVHGLFFGALMFGVSWKNPPQLPVEADLWAALPEPPAPVAPPPGPEPLPAPPPPAPVEARPTQADIALEKAEKKKQAELKRQEWLRQEAEKRQEADRREAARQAELQRQAQERLRQEQVRAEQEKAEKAERAEKARRELARRQVEEDMARQMREELDAESAQLRAYQDRAKAGRQARVISDFKQRIQAKIQAYVRLPQKLAGNPEAVFQVTLLPNGEVLRAVLVKSSGQPTYDAEVERAILKASPLPLPSDKEAAGVFRDGLTLKFRPLANGSSGT